MDEIKNEAFSLMGMFSAEWMGGIIMNVLAAIAIVLLTLWVSKLVKKRVIKFGNRFEELDETLFAFLANIAYTLVLVFGGMVVLGRFGVQTTSIVALLGAAGLAVGLALQGTLSNFASGVMLIIFRPFRKDNYITIGDVSGTVKEISLFTTELATVDNVQIIVPNGQVWGSAIINYSVYETRRVDFVFGVSYGADLKKTEEILNDILKNDSRIHDDPEPFVKLGMLNDSSVDFTVRVWCDAADYWDIKFDVTRRVKDAFDENGIEIPYPTTTIYKAN